MCARFPGVKTQDQKHCAMGCVLRQPAFQIDCTYVLWLPQKIAWTFQVYILIHMTTQKKVHNLPWQVFYCQELLLHQNEGR